MKFMALTGKAGKHDIAIIYDIEGGIEYRLSIWQENRPVSFYIYPTGVSYEAQTALDFFDGLRGKISGSLQVEERQLLESVRAAVALRERLREAGEPMAQWGSLAALLDGLDETKRKAEAIAGKLMRLPAEG